MERSASRSAIVGASLLALTACGGRNGLDSQPQSTGGWKEFISGTYDSPQQPSTKPWLRMDLQGIDDEDLKNLGEEISKGADMKFVRIPLGADPTSPLAAETENVQCDQVTTFFGDASGWVDCLYGPDRSAALALPRGATALNAELQLLNEGTKTQIGRVLYYVDADGTPQVFDQLAAGWGEGTQKANEVKIFVRE